jgi:hypothetical protein
MEFFRDLKLWNIVYAQLKYTLSWGKWVVFIGKTRRNYIMETNFS